MPIGSTADAFVAAAAPNADSARPVIAPHGPSAARRAASSASRFGDGRVFIAAEEDVALHAGAAHSVRVEDEEASQDREALERLFRAARSSHVRECHAAGQSPSWLPASQQVQHAARRVRRHPEAAAWLVGALKDEQRKWFAAEVIAALGTPEPFLAEMLTAAIEEPDPSFNRRFVEPCVHAYGPPVVRERLLRAVETGSDPEVAGAARAYYWTFAVRPRPPARTRSDWLRQQEVFLRAFVGRE